MLPPKAKGTVTYVAEGGNYTVDVSTFLFNPKFFILIYDFFPFWIFQ